MSMTLRKVFFTKTRTENFLFRGIGFIGIGLEVRIGVELVTLGLGLGLETGFGVGLDIRLVSYSLRLYLHVPDPNQRVFDLKSDTLPTEALSPLNRDGLKRIRNFKHERKTLKRRRGF